jgi:NAD(P)-dependent dehydrogenase (short-subunit alcohol dehydrogenase family)
MVITQSQKRGIVLTATALGLLAGARSWARRHYDFRGKSVVITGGSRGLGLVLARQLVRQDARVVLLARDDDELQRAAVDLRAQCRKADVLTIQGDVRSRADAYRAIAQAIEEYGRVDVIINNAGIIQVGPLDHMTLSDYDDAMQTHFWGPLYMTLAAIPHMRRQGRGRIVNISSIGGKLSVPHLLPYSASKFALTGLSDGLRAELARDNIAVTTVCPGLMRTGSPVNALFKGKRAQEYAWFAIADSLPLGTMSAERAAGQILAACQRGDAELIIGVPAKLAVFARTLAPEVVAKALALMHRGLPTVSGRDGDVAEKGRMSESAWAPSALTAPTYAAARRNNEF